MQRVEVDDALGVDVDVANAHFVVVTRHHLGSVRDGVVFDLRDHDLGVSVCSTMAIGDAHNRQMTRFSAPGGEDDATRLGANEVRHDVARFFHGPASVTRRAVTTRGVPYDAALPRRHGFGDLVATRSRRGVVEVVLLGHATKKDF